jgi:MFS transporter, DHA3 family, macrolide efflux protein
MKPQSPAGTASGNVRTFFLVLAGQVVSTLGSAMTGFALIFWAYDMTQQVTTIALASLAYFAPTVLFSPIAGALVDRWNRKLTIILSDLAQGLTTLAMLPLFATGNLQIWHWYVAGAIAGTFAAFHFPAYSAAITTMIPKAQYGRASGLQSVAESGSGILSPVLAAGILGLLGIARGVPFIMLVDIATFTLAIGILLAAKVPQPSPKDVGKGAVGGLLRDSVYGFRYIASRRSLLGLQLVFFTANLIGTLGFTTMIPMILTRTGRDALVLGGVQSAGAIGAVVGGLVMGAWGGPRPRVYGVIFGMALQGVCGMVLMGLAQGLTIWASAWFLALFLMPIINGSNQAIWQSKVAPELQGRVFAARRLIAQITVPIGMGAAGPLADQVFEPGMQAGGALSPIFGGLVGVGPGSGMALMLVLLGVLGTAAALVAFEVPTVRHAETLLPDHDEVEPSTTDSSAAD